MAFKVLEPETNELDQYLGSWGLRRFIEESAYYRWQRESLTSEELSELNRLAQARHDGLDPSADVRFYDFVAQQKILPVLYSQRYDYYLTIGSAIANHIEPAKRALDFGCGVGILTIFYAHTFPHIEFFGIDRSAASIAIAQEQAVKRGLNNVHFKRCQIPDHSPSCSYDLIISTHALFQTERDPGLPSLNWMTFQRSEDPAIQLEAETRTGLKERLESLSSQLSEGGRMLFCEKSHHLGRRVLFQRALTARGYRPVGPPVILDYQSVDEMIEDGPLYEVARKPMKEVSHWDENPFCKRGQSVYTCQGKVAKEFISSLADAQINPIPPFQRYEIGDTIVTVGTWEKCLSYGCISGHKGFCGAIISSLEDKLVIREIFSGIENWTIENLDQVVRRLWPQSEHSPENAGVPCYENHTSIAQKIWESLPHRQVQKEATIQEQDGRGMHIELGTCGALVYLYWANTYDQRQLVLMTTNRLKELKDYYHESLEEMQNVPPELANS